MTPTASASLRDPASSNTRKERTAVSLSFPKNPAMLSAVRMTVAGVALQVGLSLDVIEDLKVIAAEACTYCIQRGSTKAGQVSIVLSPHDDRFVIEVSDESFTHVAHPELSGNWAADDVADELYIIRALAEELEYQLDPQLGLRLRVTKSTPHL